MPEKHEMLQKVPEEDARTARFRELRHHFGKNQKEFSHELGLGDITWQNYERGISHPNSNVLNLIHRRLNVNLNWLAHGAGRMFNDWQPEPSGVMESAAGSFRKSKDIDDEKLFRLLLSGLRDIYGGIDRAKLPEEDYVEVKAHYFSKQIADMTENNVGAHKAALQFLEMEEKFAATLK